MKLYKQIHSFIVFELLKELNMKTEGIKIFPAYRTKVIQIYISPILESKARNNLS